MTANKTQPQKQQSVAKYINALEGVELRKDCRLLSRIMKEATGKPACMWGTSMIGFDTYHYKYASGREGDSFVTGFAPRKNKISIYIVPGFSDYQEELVNLGKHKSTVSCLYIKNLASIDIAVLTSIIQRSVAKMHQLYPKV